MEYHLWTDDKISEVRGILSNKLPVETQPPIGNSFRLDYLKEGLRDEFYKDHDNRKDFNLKYESLISESPIDISESLTFYDKFSIYRVFYPDYEVWSVVFNIPGNNGKISSNREPKLITNVHWKYSVSTSGKIFSHSSGTIRTPAKTKDDYVRGLIDGQSVLIHRLVLSTFGSDIYYKGLSKRVLTCNHKDFVTDNNELLNLEWMTHSENIMNGHVVGVNPSYSRPVKITILDDLGFGEVGKTFYLRKRTDVVEYGFPKHTVSTAMAKREILYGCKWEDCNESELEGKSLGLSEDLVNWMKYRSSTKSFPVKVTPVKSFGDFKQGCPIYVLKMSDFNVPGISYDAIKRNVRNCGTYRECTYSKVNLNELIGKDLSMGEKLVGWLSNE